MPKKKRRNTKNVGTKQARIVVQFGRRLKSLRIARGMKQRDLAFRAGVDLSYIGRLERGESTPGIDLVQSLADALSASLVDLLPVSSTDAQPMLKEQAQKRFDSIVRRAEEADLSMLVTWLALLDDSLSRRGSRRTGNK